MQATNCIADTPGSVAATAASSASAQARHCQSGNIVLLSTTELLSRGGAVAAEEV